MAYPPPGLACNGLSRHILGPVKLGLRYSTVPLHAARLWIVRAYRDRPTLTSRPPAAARSRSRGFAAPASRTAEKRLFTALTLGLEAARESGGVKQIAAFLARENQGCACCRVVRSRPTARMTASMVFRVGLPLSLNER